MKKCLVVSWYFPPINSSEGICTFKLLKNSKMKYDVFTQKNDKNWSYDTNEDKLTAPNINTIFAKAKNINDWVAEGIQYCNDNINQYDFMMSRSMAPESHEVALAVKKEHPDIPWIASFGDPIANNPYLTLIEKKSPHRVKGTGMINQRISYIVSPKRILKNMFWEYRDRKYKKKHTRLYRDPILQDEVLKNCDIIIFNNEYQKDFMLKGYGDDIKEKALVLPHGYDKDFYEDPKKIKKSKDKIVVSYLGHLDENRTPKNFLMALNRLKEEKPELYNKLEFDIYGNMDDKDKVRLVDYDLCDVVKFKKIVKYFESLRIMQESNLLLLVDANLGKVIPNNIFYAAKLADYIGSGTDIFTITMLDGPSADITKEVGGVVSSHSVEDIYNNLVMILEKKIPITNNKSTNYDMKNIAKKYDEVVSKKFF